MCALACQRLQVERLFSSSPCRRWPVNASPRGVTSRMSAAVSVCRRLCLPRTQPLFSGRKPAAHLPLTEVHHQWVFLFVLCLFYPPFHSHEAAPQLSARIIPHLFQVLVVPTAAASAPPWRTLCRPSCVPCVPLIRHHKDILQIKCCFLTTRPEEELRNDFVSQKNVTLS